VKYDFEDRTINFSVDIIKFLNGIPYSLDMLIVKKQLIRSATSIGANYFEANGSATDKDFKSKLMISRKEAKETNYWLRVLKRLRRHESRKIQSLIDESEELIKITSSISKKF
jgi:four helix bundle protein